MVCSNLPLPHSTTDRGRGSERQECQLQLYYGPLQTKRFFCLQLIFGQMTRSGRGPLDSAVLLFNPQPWTPSQKCKENMIP
ncbi:hypothetical protein FKM82_024459 [Ascaphus truei]